MTDAPKYLSTRQVAEMLNRTPAAIRNLCMRRAIPHRKPGGRLLFVRAEVERWIDGAPGVRLEEIE